MWELRRSGVRPACGGRRRTRIGPPGVSSQRAPAGAAAGLRTRWVFALALALHAALELALPGFPDRDAWFHGRLAELLAHGGARWDGSAFPWLTHSAYADHPVDWSLAWHWAVAPLAAAFGPVAGLRIAAVLQAAALTAAVHALLRRHGVRAATAWTALLLAGSAPWVFRLHFGRPTPCVLTLLVLTLDAVLRGRDRVAALAAGASLLVYQVPAPLLLVGGAGLAGRALAERRLPLRTAGWLCAGAALGIVVHPAFHHWPDGRPLTLHLWGLLQGSLRVAANGGAAVLPGGETLVLPLPGELLPPAPARLGTELWFATSATAAALAGLWRGRRDAAVVACTALALAGLAGTLRSGRFFEYWHVFALLGAACSLSGPAAPGGVRAHRQIVGAAAALLALAALPAYLRLARERAPDRGADLRPALAAVDARARDGDVVWHGSWDDFAPLFHFAPRLRFVTGMDPWWLVAHDADDARAYAAAGAGLLDDAALHAALVERFGARFVVLWRSPDARAPRRYAALEAQLRAAGWATPLHDDAAAIAFEVR